MTNSCKFAISLSIALTLTAWAPLDAQARRTGTYYVAVPVLAEHSTPNGPIVNRIYRGQKLNVTALRPGWARVTELQHEARWVPSSGLSPIRPKELPQKAQPVGVQDPRIAKDAIPRVGEDNLSQTDVDILWRGAAFMLRTKRCSVVNYAHKSTSRPNTYFVNCGGPSNVFFTRSDIK